MAKLRNQKLVTQSRLIEKVFFFFFFCFVPSLFRSALKKPTSLRFKAGIEAGISHNERLKYLSF